MGQAKQRGSFEVRQAQSIARRIAQIEAARAADEARRAAMPPARRRRGQMGAVALIGIAAALSR
jgi:hypothetical protein